ncbi:MAG: hypothetical protein HS104_05125 [Polyangiaceae bacterium]|nr:hypothetical protein [Polyangiaceae bacterium]
MRRDDALLGEEDAHVVLEAPAVLRAESAPERHAALEQRAPPFREGLGQEPAPDAEAPGGEREPASHGGPNTLAQAPTTSARTRANAACIRIRRFGQARTGQSH